METVTLDLTNDSAARKAALFYAALISKEQPFISAKIIQQVYGIDPQTVSEMLAASARTIQKPG